MVEESNQNEIFIQIDASNIAEFDISEFEISRFDCRNAFSGEDVIEERTLKL